MCSLFWYLSVPGRYYRFESVGQRVGALDVRVGSRGEVTACPLSSWKRASPGTRETSALGQVQIVILRVLYILMLFCLIAGAVVGLQFLDKTHYLSMEVPLASSAGLCWLLAAALSLCNAWSTPPPRTAQWQSFLNCYAAYMTSYAVLATGWSTYLPANTTV
jgi:hypothetical protein